MNAFLQNESERLARSWQRHDAAMLRDYLVAGVEDPRLNVQSILMRHYLACARFGQRFRALMEAELQFAVAMNWLRTVAEEVTEPETWSAVAVALRSSADNAEGIPIPAAIRRLRQSLPGTIQGQPVPDYVAEAVGQRAAGVPAGAGNPDLLDTFLTLWRAALAGETTSDQPLTVLEPACGSANDFRFLDACGLARFLDYTGFDLSEKNVRNARMLFPGARFAVGNALDIAAGDQSYAHTFVHDLFEHLSPEALEVAVSELCRVTRRGLCLGFFQMDEVEDHLIRPVDEYHVNTLSLARMMDGFARHGFAGEAVHIGTFLRLRFGCQQTPNANAYTLVLERTGLA